MKTENVSIKVLFELDREYEAIWNCVVYQIWPSAKHHGYWYCSSRGVNGLEFMKRPCLPAGIQWWIDQQPPELLWKSRQCQPCDDRCSENTTKAKPANLVYFIQAEGTNFVKIGVARDSIESRLDSLQVGCPHQLKIIGQVDGSHKKERQLHNRFSHLRERGEWFNLTVELADFIQQTQKESQI